MGAWYATHAAPMTHKVCGGGSSSTLRSSCTACLLTNWSMPCWGVRLCLSPSVCLHVHLCVCLSVCLCVHAIRQSVCLSVCTVCQPVCLSVCPSVCTHCTVCQSVCLSGFTLQVANRQCTPHSTVQYPTNSPFKYIHM